MISLTQIAKDELDNLKRLYPLVKDHIDEWVVVVPPKDPAIEWLSDKAAVIEADFTQEIEPEFIKQMADWGLEVDSDYRLFNFADARNAALGAATQDYVLWLDSDDTPIGLENVKKFIENQKETERFNAVYDYGRDEEGNPISDHIRERIIRNNGKWQWLGGNLGLIHETLLPIEPYNPLQLDIPEDIFRVEHHSDHTQESSIRNHVALLYEYLKTKGKDPRTTYYLGIEFFNRQMYDYCIKVLLEYVKVGGSTEDRFHAWIKIGEAYHHLDKPESGRNAYLEAQKEMPNRPDSYLSLGESYHQEEDYAKSIEYMMTGLQKKLPKSKQAVDVIRYTFRPSGYIALAYLELGKPKEAYEWFIRTYKMNPKHPWVKRYAPLFMDAKDLNDYVRAFVKLGQISQRLYPKTLSKLAEAIPDDLKDQELLMDFKWRYSAPKIWQDNSVVFFCSSAFEDWGPESLEKGCGGSEEAVIQLSKRLTNLGWDVTIYNNCIKEGVVDGVKWVRYERFNPRDMFNVIISWRNNLFLNYQITAVKKIVDNHDVADTRFYPPEDMKDVQMFVKSEYHRSKFPALSDDRFVIIPNGIDLSQFPKTEKVKNSMVWTSSYDRGLKYLLEMWPSIRAEVPDATLDCYYGFQLFDSMPWGKIRTGQTWKQEMKKLLNQPGVTDHGRVGTEEVAKAYLKADIWAYPTDFNEISCISAMKAQAAGCMPVSTDWCALKETLKGGVIIKGSGADPKVREEFKQKLIEVLKSYKRERNIDVTEFSWDNVAEQWNQALRT